MDFETVRLDVNDVIAAPEVPSVGVTFFHTSGATSSVLREGAALEVGRAPTCDVVLPDESLSRHHARLRLVQGQLFVEDLGSTNGTRIGDRRVKEETPLSVSDLVTFGSVATRFEHQRAASSALGNVAGYDQFRQHVVDEIVRARHFRRTAAVVAVQALDPAVHALHFVAGISGLLRPIDKVALYSRAVALVLLSEADDKVAQEVARGIISGAGPKLGLGLAVFPPHGATADELIGEARAAAARATAASQIQVPASGARDLLPASTPARVVMSPAMVDLYATIERLHRSSIPVLLQGETGVGKEIVARAVHEGGPRASKPLRSVNCGALSSTLIESTLFGHEKGAFTGADKQHHGVFETANGGTVFLDEIGELELAVQPKLLRVLETKKVTRLGGDKEIDVDFRVVAASHRNLEEMVAQGKFREDLLFRLNAIVLRIPPLRERREEIVPLAERFLAAALDPGAGPTPRLTAEAYDVLLAYPWPGNVRELKNAMERAAVIAPTPHIGPSDLPEQMGRYRVPAGPSVRSGARVIVDPTADLKTLVRNYEARVIEEALQATSGNQTLAAQRLRTPLRTLVHKIKALGVKKGDP